MERYCKKNGHWYSFIPVWKGAPVVFKDLTPSIMNAPGTPQSTGSAWEKQMRPKDCFSGFPPPLSAYIYLLCLYLEDLFSTHHLGIILTGRMSINFTKMRQQMLGCYVCAFRDACILPAQSIVCL